MDKVSEDDDAVTSMMHNPNQSIKFIGWTEDINEEKAIEVSKGITEIISDIKTNQIFKTNAAKEQN